MMRVAYSGSTFHAQEFLLFNRNNIDLITFDLSLPSILYNMLQLTFPFIVEAIIQLTIGMAVTRAIGLANYWKRSAIRRLGTILYNVVFS